MYVTFWLMMLTHGELQLLKSGPCGSQYPSGDTHKYEATPTERERGAEVRGVQGDNCTGLN